ncbi:FtsH protease [Tribonema minus]|uniref:FtsH protease n=1 Tax=Tribonema minus TaxID=303371 RepID=A0A835YMI8_9STRA|nr:FtsH protease [Tribonema minus]
MEQRTSTTFKALALTWLAVSSEAFTVSSNIRGTNSWTTGSKTSSRSMAQVAHPQRVTDVTMASRPMFSNPAVKTLAAMLSTAAVILSTAAPSIAAEASVLDQIPAAPSALQSRSASVSQVNEIRYSDFIKEVEEDRIEKVSFSSDGQRLLAIDTDGNRVKMDALPNDPELLTILTKHKVDVTVIPAAANNNSGNGGGGGGLLGSLLFPAILFGGLFLLTRRGGEGGEDGGGMGGGMGNPMEFAKSQSKVQLQPDTGVNFADVAGCDSAKLELEEVVDFLKNPAKYTELGAKIPRGVILEGPPGTGKTLLARAVAGEAGVPFIAVSGSEFVEMFVGVGASRVRDLFTKAKENAPCIIFIDEIDAVGRQRGAGIAGGNDEREQTLNQILTEMDGFEGNPGIIVIAATNRADILDSALLRPGRFDRRVNVDLPDFSGRMAVLKVHARGKPLSPDVDLSSVARRTPGFSGAQLQNLLNEAAIFAARKEKTIIDWDDIDGAIDRLLVGLEKKNAQTSERMKEIVAYHEAGHAIVGALMPDYDMVQKVTIIPRSNGAGGLTFFAPSEARLESGLYSRQYLEAQLAVALGGRLAEEIIYGDDGVTTGASNDLQQVANIARRMVTQWGMSEVVGQIVVGGGGGGNPFMGRQMGEGGDSWGPKVIEQVDQEVGRLVSNAYLTAKNILKQNRNLLEALKEQLLEQEQVTAEELAVLISKFNVAMAPYGVYGEAADEALLPFQSQPVPGTI